MSLPLRPYGATTSQLKALYGAVSSGTAGGPGGAAQNAQSAAIQLKQLEQYKAMQQMMAEAGMTKARLSAAAQEVKMREDLARQLGIAVAATKKSKRFGGLF